MTGLFTPLKVGRVKLDNRIVMPPMARGLCTPEGRPMEELLQHYAKRAASLGLLIVEHSYVSPKGKLSEGQLGIYKDDLIPDLKRLAETVKSKETPVAIQLNHAGGKADANIIGKRPVAPSSAEYFGKRNPPKTLTNAEIKTLIRKFTNAARRAMEAGFDAVEIHGAHGFLLSQFSSPITNDRDGKYGGTLENRMRFPLEVVEHVKQVMDDGLLLYRLGATDKMDDGLTIEDSKVFAQKLERKGIDILDISGGLCGSRPTEFQGQQGYFIPLAEKIKKVVDVPVIGVGGITDPKFADRVIREGRVDLVAVGRGLLRDPEWARKAKVVFK